MSLNEAQKRLNYPCMHAWWGMSLGGGGGRPVEKEERGGGITGIGWYSS